MSAVIKYNWPVSPSMLVDCPACGRHAGNPCADKQGPVSTHRERCAAFYRELMLVTRAVDQDQPIINS